MTGSWYGEDEQARRWPSSEGAVRTDWRPPPHVNGGDATLGTGPLTGSFPGVKGLARRPDRRSAAALLVMAIAFDVAAHGRVDSFATAAMFAIAAGGVLASGRVRSRSAAAAALAVVPFAGFLGWRESVWLVPIDAVVAVALLLLASSYASGGHVMRLSPSIVVIRLARAVLSMVLAPAFLFGSIASLVPVAGEARKRRLVAVARGLGIAVPVVWVLGLLLASADPVFASVFRIPFDASSLVTHSFFIVVGALLASILLVEASSEPLADLSVGAQPLGGTESGVVLGGLVLLYGCFSGAQVVAARGGAATVLSTAGLTYADYAREGFFQLLAVAAITLVVLLGMRSLSRPAAGTARVVLLVLGEAAIVLTLVVVGVAITRLDLYEQAYGLTMLRLVCTVVAWWLGAVFVIVGLAYAGVGASKRWVAGAMAMTALVTLLGFNIIDPEAIVVRRNVDHAAAVGRFDAAYLGELSDDAIPELVASLPRLAAGDQVIVRARICNRSSGVWDRSTSPTRRPPAVEDRSALEGNRSAQHAAAARASLCGS